MLSKARRLCLLPIVILAVVAPASVASAHQFHSEFAPTIIEANQIPGQPFVAEIGETEGKSKVECSEVRLTGTTPEDPTAWITFHPTLSGCAFGGHAAEFKTEGCNYIFRGSTSVEGHGLADIECEGTSKIKIVVPGLCALEIGTQATGKGVHYANTGAGASRDIDVTTTATGIHYTKDGLFCGFVGGDGEDLTLTGGFTAKGYRDNVGVKGAQQGIWVE